IGYLACFASINIYLQSFARLIWAQAAQWRPSSRLARLSRRQVPANALILVVGLCALSALALQGLGVSLSELIIYANGIFVLIYLLSMLAGVVLLQGWVRW
ncbi:MAG TPA: L-methionine/branched-chain amino acid transporter, partial [Plesiomonas shigelloides]|nr:L-methionine/branched-chain amino acid transporter [Plesiomonas shigelloides]